MNDEAQNIMGTPTPEELREQVERTRDEHGQTLDALAAKADVKAQGKEKTAAVKEQAASASSQIREKAAQAAQLIKDRTPDAVQEKTAQAAAQVRETASRAGQFAADRTPDPLLEKTDRAAQAARANRTPLIAGGALLIAFLLVRRSRGRNR
ncbi:DUF3618 domain-containing protein [Streptomyces sp. 058-1L]|uniref:DUF3618 domain-containing protein n=1 Tax=Streptomyces sp. 058-1L TaxID=2789266 RepID=UPI00398098EF